MQNLQLTEKPLKFDAPMMPAIKLKMSAVYEGEDSLDNQSQSFEVPKRDSLRNIFQTALKLHSQEQVEECEMNVALNAIKEMFALVKSAAGFAAREEIRTCVDNFLKTNSTESNRCEQSTELEIDGVKFSVDLNRTNLSADGKTFAYVDLKPTTANQDDLFLRIWFDPSSLEANEIVFKEDIEGKENSTYSISYTPKKQSPNRFNFSLTKNYQGSKELSEYLDFDPDTYK